MSHLLAFSLQQRLKSSLLSTPVRETGATFAVKSGGHGTYGSAANAMGGITVDLSRFKEITIADDRKSVFIGGGCRWGEVYRKLETAGLGVVGGRVSSVGVGGLTTAGGISFFSSERGLACDNVRSFEVSFSLLQHHLLGPR